MTANPVFTQALADACGRPVEVAPVLEATTLGAAFLAGMAAGHLGRRGGRGRGLVPRVEVLPDPHRRRSLERRASAGWRPGPGPRGRYPSCPASTSDRGTAGPAWCRVEPCIELAPDCRLHWGGSHAGDVADPTGRGRGSRRPHDHRHRDTGCGRPAGPSPRHRAGGVLARCRRRTRAGAPCRPRPTGRRRPARRRPPHRPVRRAPRHPRSRHHRRRGRPVRHPSAHRGRARRGQDGPGPRPGDRPRAPSSPACRATPTCSRPTSPGSRSSPPTPATWEFRPGPVFANVVLLDEMNRTPPRTQSALLESMEEQQVSVDGESWPLPRPHLVIGTQNPIGQLGTYPLAESQLDRFGLSTSIGYPDAEVETRLVLHNGGRYALDTLAPVADTGPVGPGHRRHRPGPRGPPPWPPTRWPWCGPPGPPARSASAPAPGPPSRCFGAPRPMPSSAGRPYVTPRRRPGGGRGLPLPPPARRRRRRTAVAARRPHHRRHPRPDHVTVAAAAGPTGPRTTGAPREG